MREDQLVISRQEGPPGPFNGNSFWISRRREQWCLSTWAPHFYEVPADADLVGLCEEFVDYGDEAQVTVPQQMVEKYGLMELSLDETGTSP